MFRLSFVRVSCLLVTLLLSACDDVPDVTRIDADAEDAQIDGFGLTRAGPSSFDGRASVLLEFSTPLATGQKFDELLVIKDEAGAVPSGSWVLESDGLALRFPYLESNRNYAVTLKSDLATSDGTTLGKDTERTVHTGPLQPLLGFASQGSVLPAHESRGLPVVTVNTAEVDVEFMRVRDRDLGAFLANFSGGGRRSYWTLEQMAVWADPVYANRFAIDGVPNERTLSYLPIRDIKELSAPGLYFAVMDRAGGFAYERDTALFFVSDTGLHVRHYPESMLVLATSLESGEPKPGVLVVVRDGKGRLLVKGETDSDGLVKFEGYSLKSEHLLLAQDGSDIAMLPFNQPALDLSEFAVTGRPQRTVEIFPWASRDLYRPGESVEVSALLRDHDGKPLPAQPVFATLRQPDGRAVMQQKLDAGGLGLYRFLRTIPADAPTGRWSVDFSVDPETSDRAFGFSFRVEEFLPERLKLELKTAAERLNPGDALELEVDADYLHGAPAAGNRFTARLALAAETHPVEALKDFWFGDSKVSLPQPEGTVIDARLDAEGRLKQAVSVLEGEAATTPVKVVLAGSVYETGGRAVSRSLTRTVWPASELVGIRPKFDMADGASPDGSAGFEVVRTNAAGELLAAQDLAVKVIREVRDYQWRFVDNAGWTFDYTTRDETVHEESMSFAAGGRGSLSVPVEWGGYRLEITDPASSLVLRQPFEAGWGSEESRGAEARPDRVKVVLDKPAYADGEMVRATLTPPHPGPALVMLEGDGLLWHTTVDVKAGTELEIPLDPAWNRHDLYLTALVFRPGSSADGITPNRAVGIAHVPLDRAARIAKVKLEAGEKLKPGDILTVDVNAPELAGQRAEVRASATDAGVLNITSYAVPDAAGWFFAPRRLSIEARDLYGRIIESFAGEEARLRYGGDMDLSALSQGRRPNAEVRIVDLVAEPVALDAEGKGQVKFTLPDFNGTLRVRALVYGEERFGSAEADTIVRAPLLVEASLPRVLSPGDEARLTLDIDNATGSSGEFGLAFETSGPIRITESKRTVSLNDGGRTTLSIPVTATEGHGPASVAAHVMGNGVDLTRSFNLVVRPAWPSVARVKTVSVKGGTSIAPDVTLRQGLFADSIVQRVSIGRLPPLPYAASAQSLLQYPYGCAEQTTSKALPLVLLDDATRDKLGFAANSFKDPDGRVLDLSLKARSAQLEMAFARLASMQGENGHFSMWPGEFYADTRITPYVTELVLIARDAGFTVPQAMLDKALDVLLEDLLKGGNTHYEFDDYEHLRLAEMAHAAYVLARAGKAPLGTLRALYDNERSKFLVPLPLVHLGVALSLAGDRERGAGAIKAALTGTFQRPDWLGDYGSELRDRVLMAALLEEHDLASAAAGTAGFAAVRELLGERGGEEAQWLSTQEQIAMLRLGRALVADESRTFDVKVQDGGTVTDAPGRSFFTYTLGTAVAGVRLDTTAVGDLTVIHEVSGIPRVRPEAKREDMQIERRWYRVDGKPWQGEVLKEGEIIIVRLTAKAARRLADALITDLAPGGLEVENLNLTDPAQWSGISIEDTPIADVIGSGWAKFEEYRDDRYAAAIDLSEGSDSVRYYLLRAVTPGRFVIPPAVLEDMYRPALRVIGDVSQAEVTITPP